MDNPRRSLDQQLSAASQSPARTGTEHRLSRSPDVCVTLAAGVVSIRIVSLLVHWLSWRSIPSQHAFSDEDSGGSNQAALSTAKQESRDMASDRDTTMSEAWEAFAELQPPVESLQQTTQAHHGVNDATPKPQRREKLEPQAANRPAVIGQRGRCGLQQQSLHWLGTKRIT